MKYFLFLIVIAVSMCGMAYSADFADDTFGILNENQKKALKELDISSELKKADQAADAHDFDKAKEICQKLLKQSGLSSEEKRQIEAKSDSIDKKRSDYLAEKAREEQRKQAEALAQKEREEAKQKQADRESVIEKSGIGNEQERQRLLNGSGYLSITVHFKAWVIDTQASEFSVKVRRIKNIFGDDVYGAEMTDSSGDSLLQTGRASFSPLKYGLYEVKVTAYSETYDHDTQRKVKKREDFKAEVIVNSDSNYYDMVISEDSVSVRREK